MEGILNIVLLSCILIQLPFFLLFLLNKYKILVLWEAEGSIEVWSLPGYPCIFAMHDFIVEMYGTGAQKGEEIAVRMLCHVAI